MVRVVSLSVLLTLIVVLGLTFFKVLAPFLLPLFLAAVFAILCEPVYAYFLGRTGGRIRLASGLTTAAVISTLLVPLIVGIVLASMQLFVLATNLANRDLTHTWREKTEPILERAADLINTHLRPAALPEGASESGRLEGSETGNGEAALASSDSEPAVATDDDVDASLRIEAESASLVRSPDAIVVSGEAIEWAPPETQLRPMTAETLRARMEGWLRGWLAELGRRSLGMAGGTFDLLSGSLVAVGSAALAFVIFAIALYYFLADGTYLIRATERLIPVHVEYQRQMLGQFSKVVRAVVMATFFAALAQSVATIVALWMFGFDHLLVLFVLCLLMSMIPMLGTWLVWLPCAIYLAWQGHWMQAAVLAVYGTVFVGMLDNLVRTYVLNTDVKLHPLLALISVLGGLQVMGLWGMFVGPIVASCLHALVRIFNHELAALSQEKFAGLSASETGIPALAANPPPDPGT